MGNVYSAVFGSLLLFLTKFTNKINGKKYKEDPLLDKVFDYESEVSNIGNYTSLTNGHVDNEVYDETVKDYSNGGHNQGNNYYLIKNSSYEDWNIKQPDLEMKNITKEIRKHSQSVEDLDFSEENIEDLRKEVLNPKENYVEEEVCTIKQNNDDDYNNFD